MPEPRTIPAPRSHRRCTHGQSVVEFTLVLGVLLLLIFGSVNVFQVLLANYTVTQATRAAAHQAALIGGDDGAGGSVQQTANLVLDSGVGTSADKATITVSCATTPCRRYRPITVRITYHDSYWIALAPLFADYRIDLTATRAAEKDQQP